jgi:hypothetical protein
VSTADLKEMFHGRRPAAVWQSLTKESSGEIIELAGRSGNLITLEFASK